MSSLTTTVLADALMEYYTSDEIKVLAYKDHPTLALLPKDEKWTGKKHIMPFQWATPQGGSAIFATAQSNATPGAYEAWELTTSKDYGVITIENEAILASEGSPVRSFVSARKSEMDGIFLHVGQSLSKSIFRNGGGARGQRGSVSGSTLTLLNIEDIVHIEKGMVLEASTADGTSGSLRSGSITVSGNIDRDLGTFDFTGTITSFADNDYLFRAGDFGAMVKGFAAWIPSTAPSSTAFFGVDRTQDKTRMGGIRYTGTEPLVERLQRAHARVRREQGKITHYVFNPKNFADLIIALGDRVQWDLVKSQDGLFGFESIKMRTPSGTVICYEDSDCPVDVAYGLNFDVWKLVSRGAAPRVLNPDGVGDFLRQGSADGVEARLGYYGQVGCGWPGTNIRVPLT